MYVTPLSQRTVFVDPAALRGRVQSKVVAAAGVIVTGGSKKMPPLD
jgi:hypothetical protein